MDARDDIDPLWAPQPDALPGWFHDALAVPREEAGARRLGFQERAGVVGPERDERVTLGRDEEPAVGAFLRQRARGADSGTSRCRPSAAGGRTQIGRAHV